VSRGSLTPLSQTHVYEVSPYTELLMLLLMKLVQLPQVLQLLGVADGET
jgi:hypothetical protein